MDSSYAKMVNKLQLQPDNMARVCKERIFRIACHPSTTKRLAFVGDKVCDECFCVEMKRIPWKLHGMGGMYACNGRIFRIACHPSTTKRLVFVGDKVCVGH